ncbi:MAG: hypothetical protein ACFFCV_13115 [Promethearchaeota archaeon]
MSIGKTNSKNAITEYTIVRKYLVRFTIISNVKKMKIEPNVNQKARILIRTTKRAIFVIL